MIKNIDCFIKLNKQQTYFFNMLENQKTEKRKKSKAKKIIENQNKNETIYFNKIDKVYNLSILHSKINWFKYYLELYIVEYLEKLNNIKNNKINLK